MSICPYTQKCKRSINLSRVKIRLIEADEKQEWNKLIEEHHYLSNGRMVGRQLKYVAEIGDKAVALIGFSNASYHLAARDNWINWNDIQRDRSHDFSGYAACRRHGNLNFMSYCFLYLFLSAVRFCCGAFS